MITKMLICLVKLCDISTLQEARIIQAQIHKENVADKENDINSTWVSKHCSFNQHYNRFSSVAIAKTLFRYINL